MTKDVAKGFLYVHGKAVAALGWWVAVAAIAFAARADTGTTVDLEPESWSFDVSVSRHAEAKLNITNLGPVAQTYRFTVTNSSLREWSATGLPAEVTLNAGEERDLLFAIGVGPNATQGGIVFNITARNSQLPSDRDSVLVHVRNVHVSPRQNPNASQAAPPADGSSPDPEAQDPPPEGTVPGGSHDAAEDTRDGEAPSDRAGTQKTVLQWSGSFNIGWYDGPADRLAISMGPFLLLPLAFEGFRFRLRIVLLLFTRLLRHQVLDQGVRGRLYEAISRNPGIPYASLRRLLGLGNGALTHHLSVLGREGLVSPRREGVRLRFYPSRAAAPPLPLLSVPARLILRCVSDAPGLSPRDVARRLGISKQAVHYHLQRLERDGDLRLDREGRGARCFVAGQRIVPIYP